MSYGSDEDSECEENNVDDDDDDDDYDFGGFDARLRSRGDGA